MNSSSHSQTKEVLQDAWDYKGRPAERSKTGRWTAAAMILGGEAVERLTTLGIAVNLVTYLTGTMHLGNATSANTVTNFLGTSFMLCLLGGFIADTFLGRYLTIAIFAAVQATGVTILTISTIIPSLRPPRCTADAHCAPATDFQLTILYLALYTTALGTGGLKSSVSGFGSDQFDESNKEERSQMTNFFNWFFFFISLGSLAAVTVLVYIQDNVGRQWGYGICASAIVAGLVVFVSGTKKYRFKKLVGSPLTQIATVFVAAWRKRRIELPSDSSFLFDIDEFGGEGHGKMKKQKLPRSKQFRFLDKAAIRESEKGADITLMNKWYISTLTDVEEVKMVIRMLPIWATSIMFWTIYAQMSTFSVSQASTMDRRIGKAFEIPAASLTAFFVGLVLSILAMVAAALAELKRLKVASSHDLINDKTAVVPLSVFWECPKGMKTMSTGLFLSTLSLGCFFSSFLVTIVHKITGGKPWLADNLNQGKLYNFYWLLAILSGLNFGVYLVCAKWYVYKDQRLAEVGIELEESDMPCHA
ncbi:Protein NRT1/ PTR FAMILY 6.3, partial [Cucurbita argyrosperma subsp. sororia]